VRWPTRMSRSQCLIRRSNLALMNDVTRLLERASAGDPHASEQLLPLVYDELRKLAAAWMAREQPDHSLQATALVHEAYMRLVGMGDDRRWKNHAHFFGAAAEAMRRILIESARRKGSVKHGGKLSRRALDPEQISHPERAGELLALDQALDRLETVEPEVAALVRLRYFAGLTITQAAATLGVAPRTAVNYWTYAKAWLLEELVD
jgi:RNA polymerase sigma factor (TIGR02999 family)